VSLQRTGSCGYLEAENVSSIRKWDAEIEHDDRLTHHGRQKSSEGHDVADPVGEDVVTETELDRISDCGECGRWRLCCGRGSTEAGCDEHSCGHYHPVEAGSRLV
jgi:hypothetical protein